MKLPENWQMIVERNGKYIADLSFMLSKNIVFYFIIKDSENFANVRICPRALRYRPRRLDEVFYVSFEINCL